MALLASGGPQWSVVDTDGKKLLSLRPNLGCKTMKANVEVFNSQKSTDISLLPLVSWYVVLSLRYGYSGSDVVAALGMNFNDIELAQCLVFFGVNPSSKKT